jgi:hypothetical protein
MFEGMKKNKHWTYLMAMLPVAWLMFGIILVALPSANAPP